MLVVETLGLTGIIVLSMEKKPAYKTGILSSRERDKSFLLFFLSLWSGPERASPSRRTLSPCSRVVVLCREGSHLTLPENSLQVER